MTTPNHQQPTLPSSRDFATGVRGNFFKKTFSFGTFTDIGASSPQPRPKNVPMEHFEYRDNSRKNPRVENPFENMPPLKKPRKSRFLHFEHMRVEGIIKTGLSEFICRDCGKIHLSLHKPKGGYAAVTCPIKYVKELTNIISKEGNNKSLYPDLPIEFNLKNRFNSFGKNNFCFRCTSFRELEYCVIYKDKLVLSINHLSEHVEHLKKENIGIRTKFQDELKMVNIKSEELRVRNENLVEEMKKKEEYYSKCENRIQEVLRDESNYISCLEEQKKEIVRIKSKLDMFAAKIELKDHQIRGLGNKIEYLETTKSFFDRMTYPKYQQLLKFVARKMLDEQKEMIEKNYVVRNGNNNSIKDDFLKYDPEDGRGKRQKWFKWNLSQLEKLDLNKMWESSRTSEGEETSLKLLLDFLEEEKYSRRYDSVSERSTRKNITIKHTVQLSLNKLVNQKHLDPVRLMNTIWINKNSKRGNNVIVLDTGESSGWSHTKSTLKNYLFRCLLLLRRKNRSDLNRIRKFATNNPELVHLMYWYADNSQIIAHVSRHTLLSLIKPSIYVSNVRVMNPNIPNHLFVSDYKRSKPFNEVTCSSAFERHHEKDIITKNMLISQFFKSVKNDFTTTVNLLSFFISEYEGTTVEEIIRIQYLKTFNRHCESCSYVSNGSNNKLSTCTECGGHMTNLSKERSTFANMKSCMKDVILESYENQVMKKELWDVPMEGYANEDLKGVVMDVFKGIPANPSKLEGSRKLKKNCRDDKLSRKREVGYIGIDASPHVQMQNDKLQYPENNENEEYRSDQLHSDMNYQNHFVTKIRKVVPESLDIVGYTTEGKKDKINNNGDNHWSRDFCFAFCIALFYKLIDIFEEHFDTTITNGEEFLMWKEKAEKEELCPMGIDLYDEGSEYLLSYVSSRRGDTDGLNSANRLMIIRMFSGFYPFYQKTLVKDYMVLDRLVGYAKSAYNAQMLHPTKNQIPGHCFQSLGACVEEINEDIEELMPPDPTDEDWDNNTEMFQPYRGVNKNAMFWYQCEKTGLYSKPGLHLDVLFIMASFGINDCLFITHCSTKDMSGNFLEVKIKDKREKILIPRLRSFVKKYVKAYDEKKKISCTKTECFPVRYDGECEYEDETPFVFDGDESELRKKQNDEEEPIRVGNLIFHSSSRMKSLLSGPKSYKLQSKIIEKGQVKCSEKGCKKHIRSVFGATRCEICGGYCFAATCAELIWLKIFEERVLHCSACKSCTLKKKCCCCWGGFVQSKSNDEEDDDGEDEMKDEKNGFDKCVRCKRYAHSDCLQRVINPSGKYDDFVCKSCKRRHDQKSVKKKKGRKMK